MSMRYVHILLTFVYRKADWVFVAVKAATRPNHARIMEIACMPKAKLGDDLAWKTCDSGVIQERGQSPRPMNARSLMSVQMWGMYECLTEKQKKRFWDEVKKTFTPVKEEGKPAEEPQVLEFKE